MKKNQMMIVGITIFVLVFAIGFLVFKGNAGVVTNIDTSMHLVQFTHGELMCIPMGASIIDSGLLSISESSYPIEISCQKTFKVTTNQCDIKLKLQEDVVFSRNIYYKICDFKEGENLYISSNYENCVSYNVNTNDIFDTRITTWLKDKTGSVYVLQRNFPSNKVLIITDIRSDLPLSKDKETIYKPFITYQKYGIYKTDVLGGNGVLQAQHCVAIPDSIDNKLVIQATDTQEYTKLFDKQNYMYANERIDFISQPVLVPFTSDRLKLINGVYGYCQATENVNTFAYYAVEQVSTFDNSKYYYVDRSNPLQTIPCCNGEKKLGQTCVNENWVSDSSDIPCSISNPCKIQFEVRYGEQQVYYQKCISGTCSNQIRTVECTQDKDCLDKQGGVCKADFTCFYRSSGCGTSDDCLDGETCINGSCTVEETSYLWWIIGGVILIILVIIIVSSVGKRKGYNF